MISRCYIFILMFVCLSCQNRGQQNEVYLKVTPSKEDAAKVWLRSDANYNSSTHYLTVFYNYYNSKIAQKKYLDAAAVLDLVSTKLIFFYNYDTRFLATVKDFATKYRNKVPVLQTTFVDNYYAECFYDKGNFKMACFYLKKITNLEPVDFKSCYKIAFANYKLSYFYYGRGMQNLSLQANYKALKYYNKINDINGLGAVYSNYTGIYRAIKNKQKAIENVNKAVHCFVKAGNKYDTFMSLYNKICTYEDFSDPKTSQLIDSVLVQFQKSKFKSDVLKIAFLDWKILFLLRESKFEQAKIIIDSLQPIVKKVHSANWTQDYDATVAEYDAMNSPKNAKIESIKNAIPELIVNRQYEKLSLFYNVLKKYAVNNNDFKSALNYEQEIRKVNDSMGNSEMQEKIIELETKYQTEKKQQQINLQETTIANKNTTIALLISLFIGILLTVIVFITRQKQKKLQTEKLNVQQYTKQLLEKTEEERKRIASDLHDSVSHELLSLKNLFEQTSEISNAKIDSIINDIRIISRNLHPIMFDKIGLKESVIQLVERTQLSNNFMVTADIDYKLNLPAATELQLYRIIQEALTNIIKYANAVAAKVTIVENKSGICIEIKDNGIGFDVEAALNGKTAFGLHNIIERGRAIGGETKIISTNKGTVVTIDIKK